MLTKKMTQFVTGRITEIGKNWKNNPHFPPVLNKLGVENSVENVDNSLH
jgi:hypothetical protein